MCVEDEIEEYANYLEAEEFLPSKEKIEMKKTYAYHKPSESGLCKIQTLREMFSKLHDEIEQLAPKSRELSVALTHLENAAMWAIKAVVCNDAESTTPESVVTV